MLDVYCYIADLHKVIIGAIHKLISISYFWFIFYQLKTIDDNVYKNSNIQFSYLIEIYVTGIYVLDSEISYQYMTLLIW